MDAVASVQRIIDLYPARDIIVDPGHWERLPPDTEHLRTQRFVLAGSRAERLDRFAVKAIEQVALYDLTQPLADRGSMHPPPRVLAMLIALGEEMDRLGYAGPRTDYLAGWRAAIVFAEAVWSDLPAMPHHRPDIKPALEGISAETARGMRDFFAHELDFWRSMSDAFALGEATAEGRRSPFEELAHEVTSRFGSPPTTGTGRVAARNALEELPAAGPDVAGTARPGPQLRRGRPRPAHLSDWPPHALPGSPKRP
ncbi:hypothetical protein [Thermomonospora umbrina]|uniref:Uncharacterized protein n=1 Tax=Thermomonospora umbrina TaxID=111806 RepID=A0A3D9T2Q5_9ACTN|nr:hypothetical protein [Thermomonospora umbrina]REF00644.1 hypothetical protein DFJ69_6200 [Thermomonospora umbrina]